MLIMISHFRNIALKSSYLIAAMLILGLLTGPLVKAGSYDVNARVDYPAPTQAAVIDPSLHNTNVADAYFNVYGTCEIASPYFIISIVRNNTVIGSTNCKPDGTFTLNVSLVEGTNVLVARSSSTSNLYGPDSQPATITLTLPPPTTNPDPNPGIIVPTANEPGDSSTRAPNTITREQNIAINEGARKNLRITTTDAFGVINDEDGTSVEIIIDGGLAPYTVTINWGDGSVESKVVDLPSKYTFKHTYKKADTYHVTGEVRDAVGAVTRFEYLVTTGKPDKKVIPGTSSTFTPTDSINYLAIVMFIALLLVALISYYLGRMNRDDEEKSKPARRKKRAA